MPPPLPPSVKDGRMMVGKPMSGLPGQRFFQSVGNGGMRGFQADLGHRFTKPVAIFGHINRIGRSADHLYCVLLQHPMPHQIEGAVQRGLAAHAGQQRIRPFAGNDVGHRTPVNRLDVHRIGHVRVRHDGRWIRVYQDDPVPLLP